MRLGEVGEKSQSEGPDWTREAGQLLLNTSRWERGERTGCITPALMVEALSTVKTLKETLILFSTKEVEVADLCEEKDDQRGY